MAHAFHGADSSPIQAVVGIDYTLSQFPTHAEHPYDSIRDNHSEPARDAVHPQHVNDVYQAFRLLRSFGLADDTYLLSGHSCGACIAFQAVLQSPAYFGLSEDLEPPRPAGLLGLNGLYDLLNLVYALDSHDRLRGEYDMLLGNAFGREKSAWPTASPARFDPEVLSKRLKDGKVPRLVLLDQSREDQLVPMNQLAQMQAVLQKVHGLKVLRGNRCTGGHAAPWEQGSMIWQSVEDILSILMKDSY